MRRMTTTLVLLLLVSFSPAFAGGGAKGDWELGIYGGGGFPDDYGTFHPKKHFLYGGRLGYFFSEHWNLEASLQHMKSTTDFDSVGATQQEMTFNAFRGNLLYNFGEAGHAFRPFLTLGAGSEKVKVETFGQSKNFGWNAGLGFRWFLSPSFNLRADGRYVSVKPEDLVAERQKNKEATLGLALVFGGHHKEKVAEVVHENVAPTASLACEKPELAPGETMHVTATAADADGDALTYEWTATAGQVTGSGATATFTFADATGPASSTITVHVSDGHAHTTNADCTVTLRAPPPKPEAVSCLAGGFPKNLSRLNNVDKACLDDVLQRLKSDPQAHVVVIGYADSHERAPDQVSQARAAAIQDYVVKEGGVDASRVTVRSGGAAKPLDTGTDAAAMAKNRRCEVWFVPAGANEPG